MLRSAVTAALVCVPVLWLGALGAANAQNELPPGPNHDLVAHTCAACHGLSQVVAGQGSTRDDWNSLLDEMISYGADIDTADRAKILEYLTTALGPNSSNPK
jgi:cytochrome c5